jgi:uncharacterized membrane protein YcaP (DUF421 family)
LGNTTSKKEEHGMAVIFFRTIIIYILLSIILRVMGKRQVGELEITELVSTLILSEIAALPIDNPNIPISYVLIPTILIFSAEILSTWLKNRWEPLKSIFESKPVILILRGEIKQDILLKMRISINELMSELRLQGVTDIDDVDYAILEQNGQLSLLLREKSQPLTKASLSGEAVGVMHPVILDGKTDSEILRAVGIEEAVIHKICKKNKLAPDGIFLLTVSDDGAYRLVPKKSGRVRRGTL